MGVEEKKNILKNAEKKTFLKTPPLVSRYNILIMLKRGTTNSWMGDDKHIRVEASAENEE